jgi:hypothetical protein
MDKTKADARSLYRSEFGKLVEDANYSAQTYYEASKAAEFWGKSIVFIPALLATVASLLVTLGLSRLWGAVGALSAAIAATASFLGTQRQAAAFRASGNIFTKIRHEARMWHDSLVEIQPESEILGALKELRKEYASAVDQIELPSNRFFTKASKRIERGVLDYGDSGDHKIQTSKLSGGSPCALRAWPFGCKLPAKPARGQTMQARVCVNACPE